MKPYWVKKFDWFLLGLFLKSESVEYKLNFIVGTKLWQVLHQNLVSEKLAVLFMKLNYILYKILHLKIIGIALKSFEKLL